MTDSDGRSGEEVEVESPEPPTAPVWMNADEARGYESGWQRGWEAGYREAEFRVSLFGSSRTVESDQ